MKLPVNQPIHGGNLVWAAALAGCPPSRILDFSASINPLGPPAGALQAIQANLSALTAYPDPDYLQLRQALAAFHAIDPAWVLPGNGAAELLTWACRELASLDCTYLFTPAFSDYWRGLKAFDATVVPIPLGAPTWEFPALAVTAGRTGWLLNNPHNPTGRLFTREQILPYLERFALVVVDEAFMDFLPESQQQSLIDDLTDFPNLVILRSLTKFYSLPGLRLGYAIAHPACLHRWQAWRDPWSVNSLAAAVGEVVLQDVGFQQQTWDWLQTARAEMVQGLSQLPGLQVYPGAANFLLVRSDRSVTDLQRLLLQRYQILIRDCISFPELGDSYFRIAIRTPSENQRLLQGLAEILVNPR